MDRIIACSPGAFAELSRQVLEQEHRLRFQAHGRSMVPAIEDGDYVLIEPASIEKIAVGDIVLFKRAESKLVVHRVIRKSRNRGSPLFLVKGDSDSCIDAAAHPDQLLGRVVAIERRGSIRRLDGVRGRTAGYLRAMASASGAQSAGHSIGVPRGWFLLYTAWSWLRSRHKREPLLRSG